MKYLCLIYQDEAEIDAMPGAEYEAIVSDVLDFRHELQESGHYIASSPLQSVTTATTIRVRNGKVLITDGPFAETREQLGGFYLIEAKDLNEAIRLASKMPPARIASIEVRPLKVFEQELVRQSDVFLATEGGGS
ncbi:YciI family protein [soil metagenome]